MANQKIIKYLFLTIVLMINILNGQAMSDFIGHWTGIEDLSSPTLTYENRNMSIVITEGGVREGFYIFTSSSDFLYNDDLDWSYHYFGFDKNQNNIIFLRRFITPVGIIGYEELVYNLTEWTNEYFVAEYSASDRDTYHQIRMDIDLMDLYDVPIPTNIHLSQNYPNPFNPKTTINVFIDKSTMGNLMVFNIKGEKIQTIHSGIFNIGVSSYTWDGTDYHGKSVSAGSYIFFLNIGGNMARSQKMVLLK